MPFTTDFGQARRVCAALRKSEKEIVEVYAAGARILGESEGLTWWIGAMVLVWLSPPEPRATSRAEERGVIDSSIQQEMVPPHPRAGLTLSGMCPSVSHTLLWGLKVQPGI